MLQIATRDDTAFEESQQHLDEFTEVEQLDFEYIRIQNDDIEEIAAVGAADAYDNAPQPEADGSTEGDSERPPVVVEESGLFIEELGGFPGPYTGYVEDTLGADRLWDLVADLDDPSALYRTGVAFADEEQVMTFVGARAGELVAPRGSEDAGFDRIFEVRGTTLAEMSSEQKNTVSSRGRALTKLADWITT